MAGAFVPLNFIAVRAASAYVHPRVLATSEGGMPGEMALTFLVVDRRDGARLHAAVRRTR